MKNKLLKSSFCGMLLALSTAYAQNVEIEGGSYSPDWESLNNWECPEWFKNAKFGIWAHWGPQCEAEDGDWYARHMYYENSDQYKWHVEHFGDPDTFGLKDLCNAWKAENWNPDSLVRLYKEAGARYFFTLGQHHDNFDLWDSPYQEWNSVNVGPKRDIVKGWSEACQKYGLPLGISMHGSHTWTWMEKSQDYDGNLTKEDGYELNPDGTEKWWKGLDPQELYAQNHEHSTGWENSGTIHSQWTWGNGASLPSEEYKIKFQNRVLQCINAYNPAALYFDDTVLPFYGCDDAIGLNILSHFYNHSANQNGGTPQVVALGKVLENKHKEAMMWDVERGIPDRPQEKYWQTCTCIGDWHYSQNVYNNNSYKSAEQVIRMLVDIVSKNGNLLLSIPIKGDGTIDDKEIAILKDLKAWMDVNSISIYGTRPWKTFGEGPLAEASNPISGQGFNENNNYTSDDVRYVQRNDTLFATIMGWPSMSTYTFESLAPTSPYYSGKVTKVSLLGYGPVEFKNDVEGLIVELPDEKTNEIAPVFCIEFEEGDAQAVTLEELITLYEEKIVELESQTGYNTGQFSHSAIAEFTQALEDAKQFTSADAETQAAKKTELSEAYENLQENGRNAGGEPTMTGGNDITRMTLSEFNHFARKEDTGTRFGSPLYWTVENFKIPQTSETDGTKNGIDNYNGDDCLMLGVWSDRQNNEEGDISNARIYQKVFLEAGTYYFGATYNTTYGISDQAYIFVSQTLSSTGDIPQEAVAYYPINKSNTTGNFTGITFTLDEDCDVYIGFQADLSGADCQEFRVGEIKLMSYGNIDFYTLDDLIFTINDLLASAKANYNTGFYNKDALEVLQAEVDKASEVQEEDGLDKIIEAYNQLSSAYANFQQNGKNEGGAPDEIGATDITTEMLLEASDFSRLDETVTTRFATPLNWKVENYKIPNGDAGTKNGIDNYPGYDCLMLGIWDDKDKNEEGNLSNARIYREVSLKAGRYFFGAVYQTTYNLSDETYIFAAPSTVNSSEMSLNSIAYYPVNKTTDGSSDLKGIFFTLEEDQNIILGFQANLLKGNNAQEMRVKEVKLLYYGEINTEKLQENITLIEDSLKILHIDENTGHYSPDAYATLSEAIDAAKAVVNSEASADEINDAYELLQTSFAQFLLNGKNPGGNPTEEQESTDLTIEKLVEQDEFSRAEGEDATIRFSSPLYWTVENFLLPSGTEGVRNGLDRYPGFDCLMLGVWDNRANNTEGDLTNARIYRTVHLEPGRYYFGGVFNTMSDLNNAYIFASTDTISTSLLERDAIAYYNMSNCAVDSKYYGIYFTIEEAQDVKLGFQTDLAHGSERQEFRISSVTLLKYTDDATGIEEIPFVDPNGEAASESNEPASYYTVDGIKLPGEPAQGLYILRQNGKGTVIYKP
ncbi:MAG: alpha-L-fucosidase [Bacteroidaceae bacterium]|jgi:alpha-L-fucosidase